MEDWEARGLEPRTAARLMAVGIGDEPTLRAWVAAHPEGNERIGRVMMSEIRALLAAPQEAV